MYCLLSFTDNSLRDERSGPFVSDIAVFVLKRDVKLQLTSCVYVPFSVLTVFIVNATCKTTKSCYAVSI